MMSSTRKDLLSCIVLLGLWLFFFWRLFTPVAADQVSFKPGDFSAQFVAFGGYQYARFVEGEIPLWNPYNNGGLPFVADPQSAAFYPPRWITLELSRIAGGWSYNALQLEAAFHVLALSFLMYLLLRRLTLGAAHSHTGALITAIIAAYGGFTSGYPPLQLALLEGSIWLPLVILAIHEGLRERVRWSLIGGGGLALGLSWLAGHSQTSFLITVLAVIYLAYRSFEEKYSLRRSLLALVLLGSITLGATAVTLLPGLEYLRFATRGDLGINAKGNGFPPQDVMQMLWPGSVSLWSPLFVGITGLLLAGTALVARVRYSRFWGIAAGLAFLLSLGHHTAFYDLLYQILPGLRFFRGQERAALLVAHSLAILAGLGAAHLNYKTAASWLRKGAQGLLVLCVALALAVFLLWAGQVGSFGELTRQAFFAAGTTLTVWAVLRWIPPRWFGLALSVILAFELFSVGMNAPSNYDSLPAEAQLSIEAPELLRPVLADADNPVFRVDGFRGLQGNYGSLYGIADIRGISPLFLGSAYELIYQDYIFNPLAWELFAVRYVFSERDRFGRRITEVIAQGNDRDGVVFLHHLEDARPFAHLMYEHEVIPDGESAVARLKSDDFDARRTLLLQAAPNPEPGSASVEDQVSIQTFRPEYIQGTVTVSNAALLSLALLDYPGWHARLNGEELPLMRAYGALTALAIPAGQHQFELIYDPVSYRLGAVLSLFTWAASAILAVSLGTRHILYRPDKEPS